MGYKNHTWAHVKHNIRCMLQPGGQTWSGGTDFKRGCRAQLALHPGDSPSVGTNTSWSGVQRRWPSQLLILMDTSRLHYISVLRSRRFLCVVGFLTTLGVWIFCPTPVVQLDHFCITFLNWEFLFSVIFPNKETTSKRKVICFFGTISLKIVILAGFPLSNPPKIIFHLQSLMYKYNCRCPVLLSPENSQTLTWLWQFFIDRPLPQKPTCGCALQYTHHACFLTISRYSIFRVMVFIFCCRYQYLSHSKSRLPKAAYMHHRHKTSRQRPRKHVVY